MPNSKNKEKEIENIIRVVKKNCLEGDNWIGFIRRLECGLDYYMDSKPHMTFKEATVFLDALLIFFELPEDDPYMFKGINGKTEMLLRVFENEKFVSNDDIVNRVFGFTDVLYYTGERKGCDICNHVGLWLAFILLGDPNLVVESNRMWYKYPPKDYVPKIDDGHLGMFG